MKLPLPLRLSALLLAACLAGFSTQPVSADDWPGFRGLDLHGAARHAADLFEGEGPGLALQWKEEVGMAYSAIAVAGGVVVALGSDGSNDLIVAMDSTRGAEIWRASLGPVTKGHDGSEDGPLSTPAIARGKVFVHGGDGTLQAFSLSDGTKLWTIQPEGGKAPFYAHSSSPIVVDDQLIVSRGNSEEGTLVARSLNDGSVLWTAAAGEAEYQSPIAVELAGKEQIVFWLDKKLVGLDLDGTELWSVDAPANIEYTPVVVGENSLLLPGGRSSKLFEIDSEEGQWSATEQWDSRRLKPSMNAPVVYNGHIYGFDRNFLTALDAETGEVAWKSRPPGAGGLVLIGDRLAIFSDGFVVLAKATPDGYQEEARLKATDNTSLSWPAFADGTLFVRDKKHVAAVRITDEPMQLTGAEPALIEGSQFKAFIDRAAASEAPRMWAEHLVRTTPSFPIREGDMVHFVFHGDAEDVGLNAPWAAGGEVTMDRLDGTNLFYRSLKLDPALRLEYGYRVDFESIELDTLNAEFVPHLFGGERSVLHPEGQASPDYFAPYQGENAGRMEEFTLTSEARGDERKIDVYLPGVSADNPPLLVLPNGRAFKGSGQLANTLNHLVDAGTLPPMVVAFVPPAERRAFTEDDGGDTPALAKLLAEELVPELRRRYQTSTDPAKNLLLAHAWHNSVALHSTVEYPEVFGRAILLSRPSPSDRDEIVQPLLSSDELSDTVYYVAWNRYEGNSSQALFDLLQDAGRTVLGGERTDTGGWGAFRVAAVEGLDRVAFPIEQLDLRSERKRVRSIRPSAKAADQVHHSANSSRALVSRHGRLNTAKPNRSCSSSGLRRQRKELTGALAILFVAIFGAHQVSLQNRNA